MARSLIIFSLVVLSMVAMTAATTVAATYVSGRIIVINGRVLCKNGNRPIQGAKVQLVCWGAVRYKKPRQYFIIVSDPTNNMGQYGIAIPATVPGSVQLIQYCKVSLKFSPLATCNVPTNFNNGIKGIRLNIRLKLTTNRYAIPDLFYAAK